MTSLLVAAALCSSSPSPQLTAAGLKTDLVVLEKTLDALHPGLNRYNTPSQLKKSYVDFANAWSKDQSQESAFLALSIFLAKIRCGHTYPNFYNQPDETAKALFEGKNKVPFAFRWINGTMVVTEDQSPEKVFPRGSTITKINGVATSKILKTLLSIARADGSNDSKRTALLEVTGADKFETFDIYYPMFFDAKSAESRFEIRKPGIAKIETVTASMIKTRPEKSAVENTDDKPFWALKYPSPNVAQLIMPNWAMYNTKWKWEDYLNGVMTEVIDKRIPNLVVDLRGNEGGNSVGDLIIPYLIKQSVKTESFQRFTKYRTVPQELRANLSTWDKSFYEWGTSAKEDKNGFFKLTRFDDLMGNLIKPAAQHFDGQVFVIIGPENSSATFEFALQMKNLKLATLVGRMTGGSQRGINGGAFFFFTLPHSKIELDIPIIAQFFPDKRPDTGVKPDIFVQPTPESIASGKDIELETILRKVSIYK